MVNVQALERVQPKDLDASEIEARLGATWISPDYITEFMAETFHTPRHHINYERIKVQYAEVTGQWNVKGKNVDSSNNPLSTSREMEKVGIYYTCWRGIATRRLRSAGNFI